MGKLQSLFPFKRRTEKKAEEKKQKVVFVSVRFLFLLSFKKKQKKTLAWSTLFERSSTHHITLISSQE